MISSPSTTARALLGILSALLLLQLLPTHAFFNYEVERRVQERVTEFLNGPMIVTGLLDRFAKNGAFPNQLSVKDRDAFATLSYSLLNEYGFDMIYYGDESGQFVGFNSEVWGTYREPVNNYQIGDVGTDKYFKACVNRNTGEAEDCTMSEGFDYVECVDDCALELCEGEKECYEDDILCLRDQKYCHNYVIQNTTGDKAASMGFVPRTYHCHTPTAVFSQQPGAILRQNGELGNCLYGDKITLVNRSLAGDYVYCGGNGQVCEDVFVGGFRSRDYDPRYRTWYTATKALQKPNWAEPYPFFSNLDLGITFSAPFYTVEEPTRRKVFQGVFAVDYTFADIGKFLLESYGNSNGATTDNTGTAEETYVVIFEALTHYMVASSTGRSAANKVLIEDPTMPCPDDASDQARCEVRRVTMAELSGHPSDDILRTSYMEQNDLGYPRNLVPTKLSTDAAPGTPAYVSQSSYYSVSGEDDLQWIILVIGPIERADNDALTMEDSLFGLVCVIGGLGFGLCLLMFLTFICKRKTQAVILTDWRFTSAFIFGCALLNLSSFTLLGENTQELCLARMWAFHFLFAVTMSPLFVKTYRMYRLVGTPNRTPSVISNPQAVAMTLPIVVIQAIILAVFTILDPPQPEDIIVVEDTTVTQRVECATETEAFNYTVLGFEVGLVLIGCILAFITRNMDSGFGQSKELLFCIYNIAFIGLVITVISFALDIDKTGEIIVQTIGTFSATVFSSAAFVLPRVIQTQQDQRVVLARRASNTPATPSKPVNNDPKKKAARSVNFSENVDVLDDDDRERPVTGWSAVESEDDKAAGGVKRASSLGSLDEDEVWTQHNSTLLSDPKLQPVDETWRSTDLSDPSASRQSASLQSADSSPLIKKDPPPSPPAAMMDVDEMYEEYTTMSA